MVLFTEMKKQGKSGFGDVSWEDAWPRVETHYLWNERMNEMLVDIGL